MTIDVHCGRCALHYRVPETAAGKMIRCRQCERILPVPNRPERKPSRPGPSADEARDRLLFGDALEDDDSPPAPLDPPVPPRTKPLPPRDHRKAVQSESQASPSRRRRRPRVGGTVRDNAIFVIGMLFAFASLTAFAPFVLYLIGLGFSGLAIMWVIGDASEEHAASGPRTGNLFLVFRLLTRPVHLWPAWAFLALGILSMLMAAGRLQWLLEEL